MNKNEQVQLCSLLAKLRYILMEDMTKNIKEDVFKRNQELIEAINKLLPYSRIDGDIK